jgi:hypothetical protein
LVDLSYLQHMDKKAERRRAAATKASKKKAGI